MTFTPREIERMYGYKPELGLEAALSAPAGPEAREFPVEVWHDPDLSDAEILESIILGSFAMDSPLQAELLELADQIRNNEFTEEALVAAVQNLSDRVHSSLEQGRLELYRQQTGR